VSIRSGSKAGYVRFFFQSLHLYHIVIYIAGFVVLMFNLPIICIPKVAVEFFILYISSFCCLKYPVVEYCCSKPPGTYFTGVGSEDENYERNPCKIRKVKESTHDFGVI